MAVVKWKFERISNGDTYTFVINPNAMTSPFAVKPISMRATTAIDGKVLVTQGQSAPIEWQFSGNILTQTFYNALWAWYKLNERLYLYDHYSRRFTVVLTDFKPVPKRAIGFPYRHTYDMTAVVLATPATPSLPVDP